jgi:hypothetical protein
MSLVQQTAQKYRHCLFFFSLLFAAATGYAQPSGGPHGPIDQRYGIPKAGHVYYVAPDAKADSPGTTLEEPTTLEAAIERVVTGDAIVERYPSEFYGLGAQATDTSETYTPQRLTLTATAQRRVMRHLFVGAGYSHISQAGRKMQDAGSAPFAMRA